MARRTKAREVVLQMLYEVDLNPDLGGQVVRAQIAEQIEDEELQSFAWRLFSGTMEYRAAVDERITSVAQNWSLKRMAPTDRNALRLGVYEMVYEGTPARVVLDETIEIARKFGSGQSSQFVNGILDKLIPQTDLPE